MFEYGRRGNCAAEFLDMLPIICKKENNGTKCCNRRGTMVEYVHCKRRRLVSFRGGKGARTSASSDWDVKFATHPPRIRDYVLSCRFLKMNASTTTEKILQNIFSILQTHQ